MDGKPVIHAWVFARGGSKGLPRKNVLPLCGKPLISYAVEIALKSRYISEIFVSTDDREIADAAAKAGATIPFMRPAELAQDRSPERLAWRHAIEWNRHQSEFPRMDIMVSLPATAPLRTAEEVDCAIELYLEGGADTVIAVSKSARHPAFNMVYLDGSNYAQTILSKYEKVVPTRQECQPAYDITTAVYVTDPDFVMKVDRYLDGRTQAITIPEEDGIDIDTPLDFKVAEMIMNERNSRR